MEGKTRCESGIKIHWHTSTIFFGDAAKKEVYTDIPRFCWGLIRVITQNPDA